MKALRDLISLSGRAAMITGGAGKIGEAFCEALAELGCEVCVADINATGAERRANDVGAKYGVKCSAISMDVADEGKVKAAIERAVETHGRLDILVNNAAYPPVELPEDKLDISGQAVSNWDANMRVMLRGTFLVTQGCAPHLSRSGQGSVINVASIYGLVGPDYGLYEGTSMANPAYYAAAKGGIVQLSRYWATTLAPKIRVNCIAPGGVWRNQPESFLSRYCARTPLGRMATEEDLKGALALLASDASAYITGQVLAVDGGWTAW